ncbi:MAG: pyridoxal phosphate-dependent aminotransferase [Prevotellaceae bacterium]|jgi:aspartate/methionine/tyrosine aminotransferase|nr:pyridoxal phosphate-dependent aminotransferase [Prevotellaceae bacterium]
MLVPFEIIDKKIQELEINSLETASIRELLRLVDDIEKETGLQFVRMEMGVPGLPPENIGVNAQIDALNNGVASLYPNIRGIEELKYETSRFIKNFLDIDIIPEYCIPTAGSMQAGIACFMTVNRMYKEREGTLFIDPGFPVQKAQCKLLGQNFRSFDIYDYRAEKLRGKLEEMLGDGKVSSILYSNPNNPSWVCFTDEELKIIGEAANKYGVTVIEDLAYFAMDFRDDYGKPGVPPYQPTVAKYADRYVLCISSSKIFSYAGERIGVVAVSDKLWNTKAPDLLRFHSSDLFGHAFVFGTVYALSSGTSHSAQHALAAMFKAASDGCLDFVENTKQYGEISKKMKEIFLKNGFKIVYDKDIDRPVADGFYFTVTYGDMTSGELLKKLISHGICAMSLDITGSKKYGLRACSAQVKQEQLNVLDERLMDFNKKYYTK